ncbi:cellular communication network factor 1, like 2 [Clupea harengus]|uniref:Cellular communication network factor 1, like 2 n=1 Tax=Clupea harengus TaxID=7950 RepID=A0A6P8FJL1_CLUHA|nr:cellular communication network factor 1, like 2 [Clupea harengus]
MFSMENLVKKTLIVALLAFLGSALVVEGGCPAQCSCPPSPPSCPMGVSWVTDACGCCRVCAQQFNQDCGPNLPCDHIKGLHCHLGAGGDPERGLCRAQAQGRPCEFNGHVYQHGEDFQPSCQHQCSCMDGVVGCMPLCPHQVPLPDWRCSSPMLATLPGRCCQEWVCDDSNHISEEPREPGQTSLPTNHISKHLPTHHRPSTGFSFQEWLSLPVARVIVPQTACFQQTTEWSECSATCGFGVSSRVTNENPECRLVKETRFCQIRECGVTGAVKKGKKCRRTVRPREPVNITFAGCTTARRYRPRTCGSCVDGRCCWPAQNRTVRLRFQCPDGESVTRSVMWIQRCRCSRSCPSPDAGVQAGPSVSLHNDIHTFQGSPSLE